MTFLGVDLGTGSAKAVLLDESGVRVGRASVPYANSLTEVGEADPSAWWAAVVTACRQAVAPSARMQVRAIGLAGQMHGVVLCRENGAPVRPAVTWADRRAQAETRRFAGLPRPMLEALGNPLAPGMAGPILLWLGSHDPTGLAAARWALQPKDWLRLRLTGEVATDPSDASATLLFDIHRGSWCSDLLEELSIPRSLLAPLLPSASVAGELQPDAAEALGLPPGTPVAVGAADTAAALLASGIGRGQLLLNVGSGGQAIEPTAGAVVHPSRLTHAYRAAGERDWYAMAAIQNVGIALEWVIRMMQSSWQEIYEVALPQTDPGADGLVFLPYLVGERGARSQMAGSWIGLGLQHDRRHVLRAALEGVGYALRGTLSLLEELPARFEEVCLAGGSARWTPWASLLTDVLGRPLEALGQRSDSGVGAAMLAALATGAALSAGETPVRRYEPSAASDVYRIGYEQFIELEARLKPVGPNR